MRHVPRATRGWTGSRLQAGSLISTILNLFFQSVKLGIPDHKKGRPRSTKAYCPHVVE